MYWKILSGQAWLKLFSFLQSISWPKRHLSIPAEQREVRQTQQEERLQWRIVGDWEQPESWAHCTQGTSPPFFLVCILYTCSLGLDWLYVIDWLWKFYRAGTDLFSISFHNLGFPWMSNELFILLFNSLLYFHIFLHSWQSFLLIPHYIF